MITIKEEHLVIIQKVEDKLGLYNSSAIHKFKIATSELLIRNFPWPIGVYRSIGKIPEVSMLPTTNLKVFGAYILTSFFNIKKYKKPSILQLVGYFLNWPFMKTTNLELSASAIYYKENVGVSLYFNIKKPVVIKYLLSNSNTHRKLISREIESHKTALEIKDSNIFIPKLYNSVVDNDLSFFCQEMISAHSISKFNAKFREDSFEKVFSFMFKFYKKIGVSLFSPVDDKKEQRDFSEDYYKKYKIGQEIVDKYNSLLKKNKKMLWGRIHGDLSVNNVLVDKENKLWLIDWGRSRDYYLVNELKNSNYDTSELFVQILNHFGIDNNEVYSFEEQIFIERYLTAAIAVQNRVIYKKLNNYKFDYIENTLNLLAKIKY